jgi:multicomponent K+:H+ antiporter subunit A
LILALIVALPFLGAVLPALAVRAGRTPSALAAALPTAAALALLLGQAPAVFAGEVVRESWSWLPGLGLDVAFFLDGLGFLFAMLILGIGLLITTYARGYLAKADPMGVFYAYLLLFQGAMLGIVLSDNLLVLVVFWELTSLSSFLLIGFWRHLPEGRRGARMALTITGGGGLALLAGVLLLGQAAGTYELTEVLGRVDQVRASPLFEPALVLIAVGAFAKSAQFPLHFWLPQAMAAPTPVSAYLHSATMVKAGVFLLARLWPVFAGTDLWFWLVGGAGLTTLVFGAAIALFKDDLKALLAYSTVSQLGLMTMLLGFGTPQAAFAAVFHVLNHAAFKAALFMSAGIVDHETGTRDARRLGGLAKLMPITAAIAFVGAAAMAGVPLFNGFLSKEMALAQAVHTPLGDNPYAVPGLVAFGSLLSAAYSFRFFGHVFWGPKRQDYPKPPHDPGFVLWGPPALLAVLVVAVGVVPMLFAGELVRIAALASAGVPAPYSKISLWHGITPELFLSAFALAGGATAVWLYRPLRRLFDAVRLPEARSMFEATVAAAVALARGLTEAVHGPSLSRIALVFVLTALGVGAAGWFGADAVLGGRAPTPAEPAAFAAVLLLLVATVAVVFLHHHRLLALIFIGIIGLVISLAFVHLSAPDLALTQLSVEVVTILLLVLALNLLPKYSKLESDHAARGIHLVVALVAGLGAAAAAFVAMTRPTSTIADYHLRWSKEGGGGSNVVNVILVDFRGFDTFGEITVLAIAALAIYALIDSIAGSAAARRLGRWRPDQPRSPERHPMMLVVATRVILPMSLTVGLFLFLRGHNLPGGGFIAGLVIAIALILQYAASGQEWAARRVKIDFHGPTALGVLVAGLTGLASGLFGRPFLTSAYDYVSLPWIGEFEVASAIAFDLGVSLTVVGSVMLTLGQLARAAERAEPSPEGDDEPFDVDPSRRSSRQEERRP